MPLSSRSSSSDLGSSPSRREPSIPRSIPPGWPAMPGARRRPWSDARNGRRRASTCAGRSKPGRRSRSTSRPTPHCRPGCSIPRRPPGPEPPRRSRAFALDIAADSDFVLARDAPALRGVIRRLAANAAPLPKSTVAATLAEADFFPEGISHDSARGVWYLGSIRHRKVSRISAGGGLRRYRRGGSGRTLGGAGGPRRSGQRDALGHHRRDTADGGLCCRPTAGGPASTPSTCPPGG